MYMLEGSATIMAIGTVKRMSPEYVLEKVLENIRKTGLDGLKPYLTAEGRKKFDTLTMFTGGMGMLGGMGMFMPNSNQGSGDAMSFLLDHVTDCEWTVKDVIKGSETAKGIVGFRYEDTMEGTLELSMVKEEEWKIDNMNMPKFDKFKG